MNTELSLFIDNLVSDNTLVWKIIHKSKQYYIFQTVINHITIKIRFELNHKQNLVSCVIYFKQNNQRTFTSVDISNETIHTLFFKLTNVYIKKYHSSLNFINNINEFYNNKTIFEKQKLCIPSIVKQLQTSDIFKYLQINTNDNIIKNYTSIPFLYNRYVNDWELDSSESVVFTWISYNQGKRRLSKRVKIKDNHQVIYPAIKKVYQKHLIILLQNHLKNKIDIQSTNNKNPWKEFFSIFSKWFY